MPTDAAEDLARRLNRNAREKRAKWTWIEEIPFGASLAVRRWRLGNGLDVHLLVDPSAPVVSYQTWFRVGSRHEQLGKTGLAHFFEHLMFKETKNHGPGEFDRTIEAAGGETNAATWVDWTTYYENLPRAELELAVRLESDRMANLVLQHEQVDSEREVVINERRYRVEDDVEGTINEKLYSTAFKKHPYHWPTIGWMEDIEGYTVDDCLDFYRTYYAPNNATLVIVGDVDEERTLTLLQRYYGVLEASDIPDEQPVREPDQRKERRLELVQPTDTDKLQIGWRGPAFDTPDHVTMTVLDEIMTGGRSSRLYRRLISDDEIASEVHGALSPFAHPGLFELWVNARPGRSAEELLEVVDEEIVALAERGPTEAELEKTKNRLELMFLHGMETANGKADQIGFFAAVTGDVGGVFRQLDQWRSVTAEDVADAARRILDARRRTVIFVQPEDGGDG